VLLTWLVLLLVAGRLLLLLLLHLTPWLKPCVGWLRARSVGDSRGQSGCACCCLFVAGWHAPGSHTLTRMCWRAGSTNRQLVLLLLPLPPVAAARGAAVG
jgi:hypothetical protein